MLKIAICDDRVKQRALIKTSAEHFFAARGEPQPELSVYDSPNTFLDELEHSGAPDIALLDICMPGILGTDVAREIRARHDKTEIIFLTTSDEYAVDAFALKAAHYLMKPFTQAQFDEAMDRAMARFESGEVKTITVKPEGGGARMVDIGEILYIESQGHLLTVHTKGGSCTEGQRSLGRFADELDKLSPGQFISPYKGYIVNQKAIQTIQREEIILRSGDRIPIPRRGFRELQNTYFDYMFREKAAK